LDRDKEKIASSDVVCEH